MKKYVHIVAALAAASISARADHTWHHSQVQSGSDECTCVTIRADSSIRGAHHMYSSQHAEWQALYGDQRTRGKGDFRHASSVRYISEDPQYGISQGAPASSELGQSSSASQSSDKLFTSSEPGGLNQSGSVKPEESLYTTVQKAGDEGFQSDTVSSDIRVSPSISAQGAPASAELGLDTSRNAPAESFKSIPDSAALATETKNNDASVYGAATASSEADSALASRVLHDLTTTTTTTAGVINLPFSAEVMKDVQLSVKNGVLTLRGKVSTEEDKRTLESRAKEMKGVSAVNNELKVDPSSKSSLDLDTGKSVE